MPSTSLSAITLITPTRVLEVELAGQRLRQRGRPGRIVRGVDEHGGCAAHALQPTGADDGGETGPDSVHIELTVRAGAEEGLDGGQCHHRVVRLVFAVQGQVDVGVHPAQTLQLQQLATDRDLAAQHRELGILAGDRGVGAHGLGQQHLHRLRHLTCDDRDGVRRTRRPPCG